MLVKELWLGSERAYACKISKQVFSETQCGNREAARRTALHHACQIIRDQTRNGVPGSTSLRERRKLYQAQLCPQSRHPASGVKCVVSVTPDLEIV
jgi:hypothetical protein